MLCLIFVGLQNAPISTSWETFWRHVTTEAVEIYFSFLGINFRSFNLGEAESYATQEINEIETFATIKWH